MNEQGTGIGWLESGHEMIEAAGTGQIFRQVFAGIGECGCGNLLISVRMRAPLPHI